jgi:hypothetical protein
MRKIGYIIIILYFISPSLLSDIFTVVKKKVISVCVVIANNHKETGTAMISSNTKVEKAMIGRESDVQFKDLLK